MAIFLLFSLANNFCGVLVNDQFGTLTHTTGSPHIVHSAYQNGPTNARVIGVCDQIEYRTRLTHWEFESWRTPEGTQTTIHCLYRINLLGRALLS